MERNDEILRYLSDMMNEAEKDDFEKRLSLSEDLKNELEKHKNSLTMLSTFADINEDSPYFRNLLPKVRTRMAKKESRKWLPKLAYLVPTATAIVLIIINIGRFSPENVPTKNENVSDAKITDSSGVQYLYNKYNLVIDTDLNEIGKRDNISFEVGVSEIPNNESIKEIVKYRYANSIEDYLLASK